MQSELQTTLDKALTRADALLCRDNDIIPPIMHPLGSAWKQPDRKLIHIDEKHALMPKQVFDGLLEYSASQPSGVYEGKMWKRHDGIYDQQFIARGGKPEWLLCWFGYSEKKDYVSNNYRKIILSDGELPTCNQNYKPL